jgi:hypothetical protein
VSFRHTYFVVGFAQLYLANRIRRLDPTSLEQHIELFERAAELEGLEGQIRERRAIVEKLSHDAETYRPWLTTTPVGR